MIFKKILFIASLISLLSACSTMSGNVVPEKGPTMEEVYDSVEVTSSPVNNNDFYKVPNPELTLYVFPHFAGKDEVPIPGYETVFPAFEQAHYLLRNEVVYAYN